MIRFLNCKECGAAPHIAIKDDEYVEVKCGNKMCPAPYEVRCTSGLEEASERWNEKMATD